MFKVITLVSILVILLISCDSGEVPSYIAVNEIKVEVANKEQGTALNGITDCWVNVNNKLVGIFEIPFQVPVLETGKKNIWLRPGIKNNGSVSDRVVYPMLEAYSIDTFLYAGEILTINPVFKYKDTESIEFIFTEDFDGIGNSFESDYESMINVTTVGGIEGKCMHVVMEGDTIMGFECKTHDVYAITKTGEAYLEINFKSDVAFEFGLFGRETTSSSITETRLRPSYAFRPTNGEWSKVYVQLNSIVRETSAFEFRPYFTCIKGDGVDRVEFFVDNIKIINF